jgi:hypothetical protein
MDRDGNKGSGRKPQLPLPNGVYYRLFHDRSCEPRHDGEVLEPVSEIKGDHSTSAKPLDAEAPLGSHHHETNAHLRPVCHRAEPGWMRGHTKPNGPTAHSKRRSPTEILHARMPPDAGEAGHGSKSDTHTDCGNYEKHGESRLRASASRTVNRPRTTTGHMRRSRAPLAVVLLPSLRLIRFRRPAHARPASGRRDLKPHFPRWRPPVLAQRPVRTA